MPRMCLAHIGFPEEWDQLLLFINWQFPTGLTALQGGLELTHWCPSQVGHLLRGLLLTPSDLSLLFTLVLRLQKKKINLLENAKMEQLVLE